MFIRIGSETYASNRFNSSDIILSWPEPVELLLFSKCHHDLSHQINRYFTGFKKTPGELFHSGIVAAYTIAKCEKHPFAIPFRFVMILP